MIGRHSRFGRYPWCATLAVTLLAACASSSGPQPAELEDIRDARRVKLQWAFDLGTGEPYIFTPALAGDSVFVAARYGSVARVDASTGEQIWRIRPAKTLSAGPAANARVVVVATEEGEVIALDPKDGAERWRARVSSEVLAAPTLSGGLVLVRSIDSRLFAFGEEDGKRRWVYQRAAPSLMVRSPSGVTVEGDTAFAGFSGGKLVAVAMANGGLRWEVTVALPKGSTELERVVDIVGDPSVQGREVCAAAYQGRVACFEIASGRQTWARDLSSLTGVSLDARYAYVADDKGTIHEIDRTSGRSAWKQDKLSLRQPSLPQPLDALIAVGDFEGYVHFLARDSGAFVARFNTHRGSPIRAAPLPMGGGLLVQTQDGALFALAL
jgi:outer membrane protein assembly factor BamB